MVQERAILKVADNSGAKFIRVFRVLGGSRKRYSHLGEVVVASVQSAEPRKAIKKKDIVKAVIVRTRNSIRRADGVTVRFDENAAVIIDDKKAPKATRIFGPIPREIKKFGYDQIFSMAEEIV
ncbi:MAG: 50S ribosomal protein L14 [Candidatus Pacebacteria bacterium]|nr:50S ribosomal protein L14 [Candidatus Paceibacterota bacterium]